MRVLRKILLFFLIRKTVRNIIRDRVRFVGNGESFVERDVNNKVVKVYTEEIFNLNPNRGGISTQLYMRPIYYKKEGISSHTCVIRYRVEVSNVVIIFMCKPYKKVPITFRAFISRREVCRGQGKMGECVSNVNEFLKKEGDGNEF